MDDVTHHQTREPLRSPPERIGASAEVESTHNGSMSRWAAHPCDSAYLTREVLVNPDHERFFERAAAGTLLAPDC